MTTTLEEPKQETSEPKPEPKPETTEPNNTPVSPPKSYATSNLNPQSCISQICKSRVLSSKLKISSMILD